MWLTKLLRSEPKCKKDTAEKDLIIIRGKLSLATQILPLPDYPQVHHMCQDVTLLRIMTSNDKKLSRKGIKIFYTNADQFLNKRKNC